ncbi:MAG: hypothetical protein HYR85_03635 [Planctomycetes bacterium]|nr:hypothetical protein [Planctomycetota bacterium]MBI3402257.1 hypothetical protein [Acidobacteriota bacterium]
MRTMRQRLGFWTVAAVLAATSGISAAEMTITGTIGDAMCGRMHKMEGSAEACTRECAKHADYALITKDKVYRLKANDKLKAQLDKVAGHEAQITGTEKGDVLQVTGVHGAM